MANKPIWTALLALGVAWVFSGCNTVQGIGRDFREAGRGIERAAGR